MAVEVAEALAVPEHAHGVLPPALSCMRCAHNLPMLYNTQVEAASQAQGGGHRGHRRGRGKRRRRRRW
eukprot:scaffold299375_cov22-Tisochrysis_lutea.AAC.5